MFTGLFCRASRATSPIVSKYNTLRLEMLESREVPAVIIQLDYSYDSGFFANNPDARAIMDRIASEMSSRITANFSAIAPSGSNSWSASFFNPSTGGIASIPNLSLAANTIKVFVGARPLAGNAAAFGGFGGYSISGTQAWINTIQTRGWTGFSLWGGSITFDSTKNWHYGQTISGLSSNKLDFYSVATHEMGHVLGIGTSAQWKNLTQGGMFRGQNAMAAYGAPVPLTPDGAHWADGISVNGQAVSLDPTINYGQRVNWTTLDTAALRDLGWGVPTPPPPPAPLPEPAVPPFDRVALGNNNPVAFAGGTNGMVTLFRVVNGQLADTGQRLLPFVGYAGAIRVAAADFNGDGIQDYAFTVGAGPQSVVQIMNGRDGSIMVNQTAIFPGFHGGLFVAAADINRDGKAELVVSADAGAGPHIQTFRVENGRLVIQSSFFAFDNPAYRGGARVAAGDLNRDGFADVIVTTGGLAEGRVAIYNGADLARGIATRLYGDFHPFAGVPLPLTAAVGDMDGDGFGDLAIGIDRGGPAHVKVWSGAMMAGGGYIGNMPPAASFYAFPPTDTSGARLAMRDLDGDGRADLVVASGNPVNPIARVFSYTQAVAGGGNAPTTFPLGPTNTFDGVYAGIQFASYASNASPSTAPKTQLPPPATFDATPGDANYSVTAAPVTHQCTCGACRALAALADATQDELVPMISVA